MKHEHEWEAEQHWATTYYRAIVCRKDNCHATLEWDKVEAILNEYAALKRWKERAIQLLDSASEVRTTMKAMEWIDAIDTLLAGEQEDE